MNLAAFKVWLDEENGSDYRTIQSRISNCRTVENHEGDLDEHYAKDNGLSLLERLSYSTEDQRNDLPANHKIPINGNLRTGSATLKQAVKLYMAYKSSNFEPDESSNKSFDLKQSLEEEIDNIETWTNFSYEKDLKNSMVSQINELFPDYKIFGENNQGVEYLIGGKRIDILLEKLNGELLVIELKSGIANYKVFGQISMYIGLLMDKFPDRKIQGMIIAGEMDVTLKNAIRTSDKIELKTYKMKLELNSEK
ncbi:endonuclease NucS domain-containing protein [Euzebyella marina]|nr:endonuclease NucS domain-containing protein [Euzebyella marina]